ncbi:transposase, partial [Staphylococcus aureus]|uniref:transposase n=1 Tax=Staphylococcus aureus TaxID=1280 RepID=UPI00210B25EA
HPKMMLKIILYAYTQSVFSGRRIEKLLHDSIRMMWLAQDATIFLMNAVYEFDLVREHQIHMTLPSLTYYYNHKNDLAGINVHLEFENLLHRSGFKDLNEIKEVLKDHHHTQNAKMIISGLWTIILLFV